MAINQQNLKISGKSMLITLKKVISQAEQVLFSHQPSAGALQEIFHFSPAANNQKSIKEIKNFSFEGNKTSDFGLWTLKPVLRGQKSLQ